MTFIRRLMEIKEEQRCAETRQELYLTSIDTTLTKILEELQGRKKDGKSNKVR